MPDTASKRDFDTWRCIGCRPFTLYAKSVGFRMPGDFRSELRQSSSTTEPKVFLDCQRMSIELQPRFRNHRALTSRTFEPIETSLQGTLRSFHSPPGRITRAIDLAFQLSISRLPSRRIKLSNSKMAMKRPPAPAGLNPWNGKHLGTCQPEARSHPAYLNYSQSSAALSLAPKSSGTSSQKTRQRWLQTCRRLVAAPSGQLTTRPPKLRLNS